MWEIYDLQAAGRKLSRQFPRSREESSRCQFAKDKLACLTVTERQLSQIVDCVRLSDKTTPCFTSLVCTKADNRIFQLLLLVASCVSNSSSLYGVHGVFLRSTRLNQPNLLGSISLLVSPQSPSPRFIKFVESTVIVMQKETCFTPILPRPHTLNFPTFHATLPNDSLCVRSLTEKLIYMLHILVVDLHWISIHSVGILAQQCRCGLLSDLVRTKQEENQG